MVRPRVALLLALAVCLAAGASAQKAVPPAPLNLNALLDGPSRVPIVRVPSLAPTVLEALKLEGVRGDMPQNFTKPLRLSELMPKLPVLPAFNAPTFGPSTSDADIVSNVTAAAKALLVPLVESTMLPSYAAALRARVADEAKWLDDFSSDRARQQKLCGFFTQYMNNCIAFAAKMQGAKVQAISTALDVLSTMEGQLNADMATKLAAFNVPSTKALGGNWLCEVGGDLRQGIRDAAARSTSEGYAAKAANASAKLDDFLAGRWAASPWWHMTEGTELKPLATPCPIVQ
ncbi:hypothetical protein Rsub_05740 [Raphidocelis subcapitata]|uniref:Uncharacterized protein n=1 Tax=Raphidocelis subcapitata TaxID=307507 RepID=A0A2V0NZ40_9CHLO|nr:hypothetical protein Rsub_05740 [Raphidocelis subcapitata]|eukprot:GBF92904.1 hypothetical protein Rsub_05740 [Raphidocelis subcapitata]